MKIVAGMGSIDEYIPYVESGVDEIFIGYVPFYIAKTFHMLPSINRREVMYYNVQIGSRSELQILSKMMNQYKVPVTITLNALTFHPSQFPLIKRLIEECIEDGFTSFIIADLALLVYLEKEGFLSKIKVHMSGEFQEINSYSIQLLKKYHIKRLIFHRKVSLENMEQLVDSTLEYEAFVLNEKCHFHGAFCQSLHCDGLKHMCLLPYKMEKPVEETEMNADCIGSGGCGLCALFRLKQIGVKYCKLVSRGNYMEDTIQDIKVLKEAIRLIYLCESEKDYIKKIKEQLFNSSCSHNCYYKLD